MLGLDLAWCLYTPHMEQYCRKTLPRCRGRLFLMIVTSCFPGLEQEIGVYQTAKSPLMVKNLLVFQVSGFVKTHWLRF
jgi:hypothetical protein